MPLAADPLAPSPQALPDVREDADSDSGSIASSSVFPPKLQDTVEEETLWRENPLVGERPGAGSRGPIDGLGRISVRISAPDALLAQQPAVAAAERPSSGVDASAANRVSAVLSRITHDDNEFDS